jgi:hypothetical protein
MEGNFKKHRISQYTSHHLESFVIEWWFLSERKQENKTQNMIFRKGQVKEMTEHFAYLTRTKPTVLEMFACLRPETWKQRRERKKRSKFRIGEVERGRKVRCIYVWKGELWFGHWKNGWGKGGTRLLRMPSSRYLGSFRLFTFPISCGEFLCHYRHLLTEVPNWHSYKRCIIHLTVWYNRWGSYFPSVY